MSKPIETPDSIPALQHLVTSHDRVLAVGNRTKPPLSESSATLISTRHLTGITEYIPSEYTFTALAGTPLAVVQSTLAEKGQYLPCAPLLRDAGATLGGAIAAGLSGPERFRYGGLRDFILGLQIVGGNGTLCRAGGKVVKNAAGFDLPKFHVGALGRFGVLTEATFKVFPAPAGLLTLSAPCDTPDDALKIILVASSARWEINAIDYHPAHSAVYLQLGAPQSALEQLARDIQSTFPGTTMHDDGIWNSIRELSIFPEDSSVVKVPITPKRMPDLQSSLSHRPDTATHYSVGANLALISTSDLDSLSSILASANLRGMTFLGHPGSPLWIGKPLLNPAINKALKSKIDPLDRFPPLA